LAATRGRPPPPIDVSNIFAPVPPQQVFKTERFGNFTYTITGFPPNLGRWVFLYFSEDTFNAAGRRKFNVSINGTQVLANFDIFAAPEVCTRRFRRTST